MDNPVKDCGYSSNILQPFFYITDADNVTYYLGSMCSAFSSPSLVYQKLNVTEKYNIIYYESFDKRNIILYINGVEV